MFAKNIDRVICFKENLTNAIMSQYFTTRYPLLTILSIIKTVKCTACE